MSFNCKVAITDGTLDPENGPSAVFGMAVVEASKERYKFPETTGTLPPSETVRVISNASFSIARLCTADSLFSEAAAHWPTDAAKDLLN